MENNEVFENEAVAAEAPAEEKQYSSFRYAMGALLAFFGISSKTHYASKKRSKLVGDIVVYIILLFGAFLMIYPFWWMIAGSFAFTASSGASDIFNQMVWWPELSTLSETSRNNGNTVGLFYNYYYVFNRAFDSNVSNFWPTRGGLFNRFNIWVAIVNNLIYSIVPVVVGVITSASAAFSFSKIQWIGRNAVFMFLLAAIMIPGPSITITQYVMYSNLNWLTNGLMMIIPGMFGSIMTAFFIRQFLFGLPTSIIEAAKIDGAGYLRIFVSFILPLAMPAIMAQGLLSFMGCWNNYMGSYIFIGETSSAMNLPHAIAVLQNRNLENMALTITASLLSILPVLLLFAIFQKQIIGSLMLTGSKE